MQDPRGGRETLKEGKRETDGERREKRRWIEGRRRGIRKGR
jgi:hypothetical protein